MQTDYNLQGPMVCSPSSSSLIPGFPPLTTWPFFQALGLLQGFAPSQPVHMLTLLESSPYPHLHAFYHWLFPKLYWSAQWLLRKDIWDLLAKVSLYLSSSFSAPWLFASQFKWFFFQILLLLGGDMHGRGTEGERERSRHPAQQGAQCGTWSQDPQIMTWAKGSHSTNWTTQGPPQLEWF